MIGSHDSATDVRRSPISFVFLLLLHRRGFLHKKSEDVRLRPRPRLVFVRLHLSFMDEANKGLLVLKHEL